MGEVLEFKVEIKFTNTKLDNDKYQILGQLRHILKDIHLVDHILYGTFRDINSYGNLILLLEDKLKSYNVKRIRVEVDSASFVNDPSGGHSTYDFNPTAGS